MVASVSYRLDESLKQQLAARAAVEGITESALVTRLLQEGLKLVAQPGITYRGGPSGRRAALVDGPDVWEVVVAARHAPGKGDARIADTAEQMGLPERAVRVALTFAAAYPDEIEARIEANEEAARRAALLANGWKRLLGE